MSKGKGRKRKIWIFNKLFSKLFSTFIVVIHSLVRRYFLLRRTLLVVVLCDVIFHLIQQHSSLDIIIFVEFQIPSSLFDIAQVGVENWKFLENKVKGFSRLERDTTKSDENFKTFSSWVYTKYFDYKQLCIDLQMIQIFSIFFFHPRSVFYMLHMPLTKAICCAAPWKIPNFKFPIQLLSVLFCVWRLILYFSFTSWSSIDSERAQQTTRSNKTKKFNFETFIAHSIDLRPFV